ncbi:MAG TPA: RNA polymerase sigma factor [Thermoanaerobaculia bacterium]|nr:RNA polymerase sigma factor [Thermoanaerobaculia bacterium]
MNAPESPDVADRPLVGEFLATGDESAFRALYRRHAPLVYGLVLRLCGNRRAEADDVFQETWIRAIAGLGRFRWESALSTWLCGIAVRCARELERRSVASAQPESDPAEGHASAGEPGVDLDRALAALPPGYREILLLHDVFGYTHTEIASLLEIEPGTSKSQLSRARRAARERLEGNALIFRDTDATKNRRSFDERRPRTG